MYRVGRGSCRALIILVQVDLTEEKIGARRESRPTGFGLPLLQSISRHERQ